jgi:UDP-N-acetylmuramoyl-tripeptide--D-alanyl-D-alanine ligase
MEQVCFEDLRRATEGQLLSVFSTEIPIKRVCIDSRDVRSGDLFWALKGERFDGHDFIHQAIAQGAIGCVSERTNPETTGSPTVIVDDSLLALGRFSNWYRRTLDALVIGVTGSVGKTTTRDLIHSALSSEFDGVRSSKNFNNQIGLPLSLIEIERHHEFAVVEMGAARIGDVRLLAGLAMPEFGVVTAVGPAHMESFGCLEAIIRTKGELLESLPSTGLAILPGDDLVLRQMADRAPCPVIFIGEGDDNHLRASNVHTSVQGLQFQAGGCDYDIPVCGRHHLTNALCAIAIAREIGISPQSIQQGLSYFRPIEGRSVLKSIGPWTVIDDTYNANPPSVAAACQTLKTFETSRGGQRILVLGDMKELGSTAVREHERIGELAAHAGIEFLLACGEYSEHVAAGAERSGLDSRRIAATHDIETAKAVLDCWIEAGDVILVKGSRATRMERIVEWLQERAVLESTFRDLSRQRYCA